MIKAIEEYNSDFVGKSVFLMVDFCAFGSNIEDLHKLVDKYNLKIGIDTRYLSFEYMLLKSNMFKYDIDMYIENHRLEYSSLEVLSTSRLTDLTVNTPYHYSKKISVFAVCYYLDCCKNINNHGQCKIRTTSLGRNKLVGMLKDTVFEYLLLLSNRIDKKQ